jgi:hypothetical protein
VSTVIIISRPPGTNGPNSPEEVLFEGDIEIQKELDDAHAAIDALRVVED